MAHPTHQIPQQAGAQIEAANRIATTALSHAKAAMRVQMETTEAMLDAHIALTQALSTAMTSGADPQSLTTALSKAAQDNTQRYMAQSQRLAEIARQAQSECIEAVMGQFAKSEDHLQELGRQFGMPGLGGATDNPLAMMQSFLKIAATSAEQFGGAMQTAAQNAMHAASGQAAAAKASTSAPKPVYKATASKRR